MLKITTICGDGVGIEIMKAAIHVLSSLDLNIDFDEAYAGKECLKRTGSVLPEETIKKIKRTKITLFGAVTSVPYKSSAILSLRKQFDLFANIRPIKSYDGVNCLIDDLDFVILRENTEGLYSGIERLTEEGAEATRVITKKATERICDYAFRVAEKQNRKKVTCAHKANVLKKSDGLFKDTFYEVAKKHPKIEKEDYYIDAMAMYLITRPQDFDFIVTSNLYGDILSDEAAGLVGGLGMVPSANIGKKYSLFEPVHGSAPDIAGKNISNPTAMILSTVMMLKHANEYYYANKVENAIKKVLYEGKVVTPDLGGNSTTSQMAKEIVKKLDEN